MKCQKKHQTSKGFIRKCNVTTEDSELYQDCQDIQDAASWEIQCKLIEKLPKEIKQLNNNFKKVKARLFLNCKNRASSLYMKVRKEMNSLSDKLKKVKEKKSNKNNSVHRKQRARVNDNMDAEFIQDQNQSQLYNVRKHHRRLRSSKNKTKRNRKKKIRRKRKLEKKKEEWRKLLRKSHEVNSREDMYEPVDNTNYQWSETQKRVASLGLKFVPTVRRHNNAKKLQILWSFLEC